MVKIFNIPDDGKDKTKSMSINESNSDSKKPSVKNEFSNNDFGIFSNTYVTRNQLGSKNEFSLFSNYDSNRDGRLDTRELVHLEKDYKNVDQFEFENEQDKNDFLSGLSQLYNKAVDFIKNGDRTKIYRDGVAVEADGNLDEAHQGNIGDCWLIEQLSALWNTEFGHEAIKNSVKKNDDGSYTVKIEGAGYSQTFTPEEIQAALDEVANYDEETGEYQTKYADGDIDLPLMELAFEKYYDGLLASSTEEDLKNQNVIMSSGDLTAINSASSLNSGYNMDRDIEIGKFGNRDVGKLLTGVPKISVNSAMADDVLKLLPSDIAITFDSEYQIISNNENTEGNLVKFSELDPDDQNTQSHEYSIKTVKRDQAGNIVSVTIENPWNINGVSAEDYEDGAQSEIELSYEQFKRILNPTTNINIATKNGLEREKISDILASKLINKVDLQGSNFLDMCNKLQGTEQYKFIESEGGIQKLNEIGMQKVQEYTNTLDAAYKKGGIAEMNSYIGHEVWAENDDDTNAYMQEFMAKPLEERTELNKKMFYSSLGFRDDEITDILKNPDKLQYYSELHGYKY